MKSRFKATQTYLHKLAVIRLADWLCGSIEDSSWLDSYIIFTPDVTCYQDGVMSCIYEVAYKNINGRKLGFIDYYCFRTGIELTVYEVPASYILSLTEKPPDIKTDECYILNPFKI
jgi:hypothetical protein